MRNLNRNFFRRTGLPAIAITAALASLTGCAQIHIDSFRDPAVDFKRLHNWAWSPEAGKGPFDIEFPDSRYAEAIRAGITLGLTSRGYRETDRAQADFLVSYHAVRTNRESFAPVNETSRVSDGWFSQTDDQVSTTADSGGAWADEFDEAELIADIMLTSEKIMAWRGKAKTEIIYVNAPERQLRRVKRAVKLVMEKFPPRPGS